MEDLELFTSRTVAPSSQGSVFDRLERAGFETLIIRELKGSFQRIATCPPGTLAVFSHDPFKSASLDLRFGAKQLHLSEIYPADRIRMTWRGRTVIEILETSGVSASDVGPFLRETRLVKHADTRADELPEGFARTLVFLTALICRARVVLLDRPFSGMDAEQAEGIGRLVLDRVRASRQILLITRTDRIPGCWQKSPVVRIEGRRPKFFRTSGIMRFLRRATNVPEPIRLAEQFIVTSPQVLTRVPTPSAVMNAVQNETILNNFVIFDVDGALAPPNETNGTNGTNCQRKNPRRPLTKVTAAVRIARVLAVQRWWYLFKKKMFGPSQSDVQALGLPPLAKLQMAEEKLRIRALEIALGIVIVAFLAYASYIH